MNMTDEHLISLQPGTVIGGKYEVVKCLGSGSMGLVYACRHRELQGQMVAVKVLFPEVAQDRVASARFRNEILASYGVSHPNVVRAYEYLRDGDIVAYTMEYVGGGDLAERLSQPERMPIAEIIRVLSQMAAGVQAIHDAGIVHRDLKPENILLTADGNVKIGDFGIARNRHGPKLTEHGGVVGTIDYVAPEYMLRSQVDWRSDIYAIGILAYEMVTGESPFRGDSVYATMTKRLKTDPESPSKLRPECSPELDAIILKAMQREPESRYQAGMGMFFDLQKLAADLGMRSAITGGLFLPNQGAGQGSSYVGPTLSEGPVEGATDSAPPGAGRPTNIAVSAGPIGDQPVSSEGMSGRASNGRVRSGTERESPPQESTEVMGASYVDYAVETQVGPLNPAKLGGPRVEPAQDVVSDDWSKSTGRGAQKRPSVGQFAGLSKKYADQGRGRPSMVGDAVALVVAALIGIGFGFVFLNYFAPGLLEKLF